MSLVLNDCLIVIGSTPVTLDSTSYHHGIHIRSNDHSMVLRQQSRNRQRTTRESIPSHSNLRSVSQVGGKILIYHPDKDFTLQKKGTVVLFNNFDYLFELNLDDQDRAYIGKRRIDIEAHNKLTPAERNR